MQSDNSHEPEIVRKFPLAGGAAQGFLVVDSLLGGGGTGGIRAGDDITLDEVAALAREMTYKFSWLHIPRGGAKSGICFQTRTDVESSAVFRAFGEQVRDLLASGQYVAGQDLGVGDTEFREVMEGAGMAADESSSGGGIDSNYYTALTVFIAMRTAVEHQGRTISESTILVEGVGKVGRHLMQLLDEAGARVVGASTISGALTNPEGIDVARLVSLSEEYGDDCVHRYGDGEVMPPSALYRQSADVLVPGARVNAIDKSVADELAVRAVVAVANAAATPDAESVMFERGVLFVPGFVCNSGGIFCWFMAGQDPATRYSLLDREFAGKVRSLLREAGRRRVSAADLAREQARDNARRMMTMDDNPAAWAKALGALRKLSPRRLPYVVLKKLLGKAWARQNTIFVHWYFGSRYLN